MNGLAGSRRWEPRFLEELIVEHRELALQLTPAAADGAKQDLVQPRAAIGARLEPVERLPGAKVGFLHDVLGRGGVAHYAPGHAKQLVEVDERRGVEGPEIGHTLLYACRGRLFPFGRTIRPIHLRASGATADYGGPCGNHEQAGNVAAGGCGSGRADDEPARSKAQTTAGPGTTLKFFPGFKSARVKTSGAEINLVHAGSGPPLLLMHGAPQTHVSMRHLAADLAKDYTVIVPDLRGYGESSKPPDGENHVNYSKRAMALDQVEVMKSFGFDKFAVVGHDRGGRVGHRLALDHADKVTRLCVLDIIPTHYLYTHVTIDFIQAYFHWFNYVRAAPAPENDLLKQYEAQKARVTNEIQLEYLRTSSDPSQHPRDVRGLSRRRVDRSRNTTRPTCRRRSRARC